MNRVAAVAAIVDIQEELANDACGPSDDHDRDHARVDLALLALGVSENEITQARASIGFCDGMTPSQPPQPILSDVAMEACASCGRDVPMGEQMYRVTRGQGVWRTRCCLACGERAQAAWWAEFHQLSAHWRADYFEASVR